MRYFKGDIVQIIEQQETHYYASELIGVNETIDRYHYKLWYRPLKNRVKQLLHYIKIKNNDSTGRKKPHGRYPEPAIA